MINELSQMCINGVDYELKDSVARQNMISVTDAKVGQTIKIAEVDSEGIPTKWTSTNVGGGCEVAVDGKALVISNDAESDNEIYELIETIICDGTYGNISKSNLSLKKAKIYLSISAASAACSMGLEAYNDAGMFGYAWLGNAINTGERFSSVFFVSDGRNAYAESVSPVTAKYNTGTVSRTAYYQNAETPIKRIGIYASGSGNLIPAGSTIEIWGVRV